MEGLAPYRRIGRTTRMLTEAIRLAKDEGKHVVVWAADTRHVKQLYTQLEPLVKSVAFGWSRSDGVTVCYLGEGRIEIRSVQADKDHRILDFGDSGQWSVVGYGPSIEYLIDHYTLERIYPVVIREWVRFIP